MSAPVTISITPGGAGLRGLDAADLGVRAIAAQEKGGRLFVHVDVGGVAAAAGDEANIFAAAGEFLIGQVSLRCMLKGAHRRTAGKQSWRVDASSPGRCPGCGAARSGARLIRDRRRLRVRDDPGSAAHHSASLHAALRPGNALFSARPQFRLRLISSMTMELSRSASPCAHAGLQDLGVNFQQRQLLAGLAGLVEHEMSVLEGLPHAAFRREFAGDHLRSLGIHHLRGRSRFARHLEECRRIEPEAGGEHQPLGKRQPVERQECD